MKGGVQHESTKGRRFPQTTSEGKTTHTGTVGRTIKCIWKNRLKMGNWCFPNKKILRNSPCLPACKQKNIATRLRDTT